MSQQLEKQSALVEIWICFIGCIMLIGILIISVLLLSGRPPANAEEYTKTGYHISNFRWHNNHLYFGAGYCLYQLNPRTQGLHTIRCAENKDRIFGRPIVDDQHIFSHIHVVAPVIVNHYHYLEALDATTSNSLWRYNERWYDRDYIFLAEGLVYTVGHSNIRAIDASSGRLSKKSKSGYTRRNHPFIIQDNTLWYAVSYGPPKEGLEGTLYRNDLQTGKTQIIDFRPRTIFEKLIHVDEEWVIALGEVESSNRIIAINQKFLNRIAWESTPIHFSILNSSRYKNQLIINEDYSVKALDITTGDQIWKIRFSTIKINTTSQSEAVTLIKATSDNPGLYGVDAETGLVIWKHPSTRSSNEPLVVEDIVYTGYNNLIDAIDLKTGELLWRIDIDSAYEYYDPPS